MRISTRSIMQRNPTNSRYPTTLVNTGIRTNHTQLYINLASECPTDPTDHSLGVLEQHVDPGNPRRERVLVGWLVPSPGTESATAQSHAKTSFPRHGCMRWSTRVSCGKGSNQSLCLGHTDGLRLTMDLSATDNGCEQIKQKNTRMAPFETEHMTYGLLAPRFFAPRSLEEVEAGRSCPTDRSRYLRRKMSAIRIRSKECDHRMQDTP